MKIALACKGVLTGNKEFNMTTMIQTLQNLSGSADLVLFGESVLQGFDSLCWDYGKDCMMAVRINGDPIQRLCAAAREYDIAVSFGYIERGDGVLYSSQIFIGADGSIIHNFRRVSTGWKELCADSHYVEGERFEVFTYRGVRFAIGLCGDLWTQGRPEEMKALGADMVLWPVWCDYGADEWNRGIKYEYAQQAARCGDHVLLVNPFCADPGVQGCAAGGAAHFSGGKILAETPGGEESILVVEFTERNCNEA